ncbi:MAG: DUF998 domain-containing protein [Promethearchaeota archaeon]
MSGFKDFITGKLEEKEHGFYLIFLGIPSALLLIATISMYDGFSFMDVWVSALGNPDLNPRAWWLFSILLVTVGTLLFPHFMSIFNHLHRIVPRLAIVMMMFLVTSQIGMVGVGLFNETMGVIHDIVAIMAFGGMAVVILMAAGMFSIIIYKKGLKDAALIRSFVVVYACVFTFVSIMAREFVIHGFVRQDLDFAEWMAFFAIFTWIFGVYFLIYKVERKN